MDLDGRAAIVTGGGTGIGRATALGLARRGCSVVVSYSRSVREAERTAAEIASCGVRGMAVKSDVADDDACRSLVETVVRECKRLDVVVNNAGTTVFVPHSDLDAISTKDWQRIYAVNTIGPFLCARAAKAAIEASGGGEIVNVSSIAGINGTGTSIPYCASKAALNNLTLTLARVMAPHVRVNAIAPGFTTGGWLERLLGDRYEEAERAAREQDPHGRVGTAEDVRDTILSVITGSDLVTGQVIVCDGGRVLD